MLDKTIEQLKKELHSARASASYHKNKNKPRQTPEGGVARSKSE